MSCQAGVDQPKLIRHIVDYHNLQYAWPGMITFLSVTEISYRPIWSRCQPSHVFLPSHSWLAAAFESHGGHLINIFFMGGPG